MSRKRAVKRFTVELSPEDYEVLEFLSKELGVTKAEMVRMSLRRYLAEMYLSMYVHDLKMFIDFLRDRIRGKDTKPAG